MIIYIIIAEKILFVFNLYKESSISIEIRNETSDFLFMSDFEGFIFESWK